VRVNTLEAATPSPLLDTEQLADLLDVSHRTPERWRTTGDGPPYIKLGHQVRYRLVDVEHWLDARRRTHTHETPDH
jgi:predicted DNA-binding transcriptional regulator AlpA